MNDQEFKDMMETRFEITRATLARKAEEYARGDRLSTFKRAAGAMGCTPKQALIGMFMKHIVSIIDCVNDETEGKYASMELWNEKVGDSVNYLILLEGLVKE